MWNIILLSGLTCSGKNTQMKLLFNSLKNKFNVVCINQNNYYVHPLPKTTMKNKKIKNIHTFKSFNIEQMQQDIYEILTKKNKTETNILIIKGRALCDFMFKPLINTYMLDIGPIKFIHIHLKITTSQSINRQRTLGKKKCKNIMKYLEFPFYLETIQQSTINVFIDGTLKPNIIHNRIKLFIDLFIRI